MPLDKRTIPYAESELDKPNPNVRQFLRVSFPAPVGTLRLTNFLGGFTGNIDGTSQTWSYWDFQKGRISQGRESIATVSWIEIADGPPGTASPFTWTGYVLTPGIQGVKVRLYEAEFDRPPKGPNEAGAAPVLLGAWPLYFGQMDDARDAGPGRLNISLLPPSALLDQPIPPATWGDLCTSIYGDEECTRVPDVTFPTCPKTREACVARGNQARFNGDPWIPQEGDVIVFGETTAVVPTVQDRMVNIGGIMMLVTGGPTYSMIK